MTPTESKITIDAKAVVIKGELFVRNSDVITYLRGFEIAAASYPAAMYPPGAIDVHTMLASLLLLVHAGTQRGLPFSRDEIQNATGLSINAVTNHIHRLHRLGMVRWEPFRARSLVSTFRFISKEELP